MCRLFFLIRLNSTMTSTLSYYNQNATTFFANTISVDMSVLHDRFLSAVSHTGSSPMSVVFSLATL